MKAGVLEKYGLITWKDVPDPVSGDSDVLIKVTHASICGTDQHILKGEFHPRTRLPLIPGHEFAGMVAAVGSSVERFKTGDKVTVDPIIWCGECAACKMGHFPACTKLKLVGIDLDGGFAELLAVPEFMVYPVDDNIPGGHAALIGILSVGFHATKRAKLQAGDSVLIWGAGKVGQSILQAVRTITSGLVFMVDILDKRLRLSSDNYSNVIPVNALIEDPVAFIKDQTNGRGVDVAFEAVGHATLQNNMIHPVRGCVQSIRGAGKVCTLGLADNPAPIVMKELIWKEGLIITSRGSHGEYPDVIQHLKAGKLKPEILISRKIPADQMQKGFDLLESEPEHNLKIIIEIP